MVGPLEAGASGVLTIAVREAGGKLTGLTGLTDLTDLTDPTGPIGLADRAGRHRRRACTGAGRW